MEEDKHVEEKKTVEDQVSRKKAQLEAARLKKAEKARQKKEELDKLAESAKSFENKAKELEQRMMNYEVQKEVKADPTPSVVTRPEVSKKRKEPTESVFSGENIFRTGALLALAGASYLVRNWRPSSHVATNPTPVASTPAASTAPAPDSRQAPYSRPVFLDKMKMFI